MFVVLTWLRFVKSLYSKFLCRRISVYSYMIDSPWELGRSENSGTPANLQTCQSNWRSKECMSFACCLQNKGSNKCNTQIQNKHNNKISPNLKVCQQIHFGNCAQCTVSSRITAHMEWNVAVVGTRCCRCQAWREPGPGIPGAEMNGPGTRTRRTRN